LKKSSRRKIDRPFSATISEGLRKNNQTPKTMDKQREKEIQALCKYVLAQPPYYRENQNSYPDHIVCPHCKAQVEVRLEGNGCEEMMEGKRPLLPVTHRLDCPYIIAKGLATSPA
jgi:hypothetical protein